MAGTVDTSHTSHTSHTSDTSDNAVPERSAGMAAGTREGATTNTGESGESSGMMWTSSSMVRFRPLVLLRSIPLPVWFITVLFTLLLTAWSVLMPQYHAPDEPNHVDAVLRLVQGEGWPHPGHAFVLPDGVGAIAASPYGDDERPYDLAPGPFTEEDAPPKGDRPTWDELSDSPQPPGGIQQLVQHPPLYYLTGAAVLWALPGGDGDDLRWDVTIGILRLMSVLMIAPLPLLAWAGAHRLSDGNRFVATSAALVPLAIPQLTHIGSAVSNDNLLALTAGLATVTIIYVLRGDTSLRTAAWTGTFIGLALFTKSLGIVLVPMAAFAYLVTWSRARRDTPAAPAGTVTGTDVGSPGVPDDTKPFLLSDAAPPGAPPGATRFPWRQILLGGIIMVALGGWWWIVNVVRYHTFQPETPNFPLGKYLPTWGDYVEILVNGTVLRWWGSFGWFEVNLPTMFVRPASAAVVLLFALALIRGPGWRMRVNLLFMLWPVLGLFGLMTLQSALAFNEHNHVSGISGRYLYAATISLAVGVGMGTRALGRLPARIFPLLFLGAAAVAQWWSIKTVFPHYWQPPGGDLEDAWDAMIAWSPWPERTATIIVWLGVVFAAMVLLSVAVMAARGPERDRRGSDSLVPAHAGAGTGTVSSLWDAEPERPGVNPSGNAPDEPATDGSRTFPTEGQDPARHPAGGSADGSGRTPTDPTGGIGGIDPTSGSGGIGARPDQGSAGVRPEERRVRVGRPTGARRAGGVHRRTN